MTYQASRCTQSFLGSDKTIDLDKIKDYKIKLDDETYKNFRESKKAGKSFKKKIGFIKRISCTKIVTKPNKYPLEYKTCKTYQTNKEIFFRKYIESLTKKIKSKITIKLKKTLKNPKENRINRLACYIKILIDISNTTYCRNNRLSVSSILSTFENKYRRKDNNSIKQRSAKSYLEYLLTNKSVTSKELTKYMKWYRKDDEFLSTLKNIIESACK
jgi:hypothetical protein